MVPLRPPLELVDNVVAEILLRLPLDEPTCLVRTSLACKRWCRVIAKPRCYREFHRTPPPFSSLHNSYINDDSSPLFIPTAVIPCPQPAFDYRNWWVIDCCHCRVLLH
ncbi:hypothetical protein E2562_026184 [Oryza meyeriana var. granulata]|uniref:F-box domain-containing protein n=1 Tax=Oryza meyeriana var. granulata TaxID=110450 RepID=A0A6G1E2B1_9ORYZ|nr:hypothetical protein E2562_026184 [Oryza meyeriana var. granulata]